MAVVHQVTLAKGSLPRPLRLGGAQVRGAANNLLSARVALPAFHGLLDFLRRRMPGALAPRKCLPALFQRPLHASRRRK
jgi:hypothetical protein